MPSAPTWVSVLPEQPLEFSYESEDPDHFRVDYSEDGEGGWTQSEVVAGNLRETVANGEAGTYYRVVACDAENVEISQMSDVVMSNWDPGVLSYPETDTWAFEVPNGVPDKWALQESADEGLHYTTVDTVDYEDTIDHSSTPGHWYRAIRAHTNDDQYGPWSNVLKP
jgi:hypothetical protein